MAAGFGRFAVRWRGDPFRGAARPRAEVRAFGTYGLAFEAIKP